MKNTIKKVSVNIKAENWAIISIEGEGTYLQSYNSIIAARTPDGIFLDKETWNYSTTTGKHRNEFLGETKEETKKKIKSGEYKLIDLN